MQLLLKGSKLLILFIYPEIIFCSSSSSLSLQHQLTYTIVTAETTVLNRKRSGHPAKMIYQYSNLGLSSFVRIIILGKLLGVTRFQGHIMEQSGKKKQQLPNCEVGKINIVFVARCRPEANDALICLVKSLLLNDFIMM